MSTTITAPQTFGDFCERAEALGVKPSELLALPASAAGFDGDEYEGMTVEAAIKVADLRDALGSVEGL